MPTPPDFAARLRATRAARKIEKTDLAAQIGVQVRTITSWEGGETEPTASLVAALANIFAVSADYLLGRVDSESGLTPGDFLVDLDAVEHPTHGEAKGSPR